MFGDKIDYYLLRLLAHDRNRANKTKFTKEPRNFSFDLAEASNRLEKLITRFEGNFRVAPNLSYLDVGCGNGELDMALIRAGATDVTGVELVEKNVQKAKMTAQHLGYDKFLKFVLADIKTWEPPKLYDVVLSHEALEHIERPDEFIAILNRLVKPSGVVFLAFGPLFYSPFGDHLDKMFRWQIPWRGVIFSKKALLRLRREFYRPDEVVGRLQDIAGGLNLMRYSDFLQYTCKAGFRFQFLSTNPQIRKKPTLYLLSEMLTRIPSLQDYFTMSVYAVLKPVHIK